MLLPRAWVESSLMLSKSCAENVCAFNALRIHGPCAVCGQQEKEVQCSYQMYSPLLSNVHADRKRPNIAGKVRFESENKNRRHCSRCRPNREHSLLLIMIRVLLVDISMRRHGLT